MQIDAKRARNEQGGEIAQLQMKIHDAEEEQQEVQEDLAQTNAHITQLKLQLQALEKKHGNDPNSAAKKSGEQKSNKLAGLINKQLEPTVQFLADINRIWKNCQVLLV